MKENRQFNYSTFMIVLYSQINYSKRMNVHNKENSGQPSVATDGFKARIDEARIDEDTGILADTQLTKRT